MIGIGTIGRAAESGGSTTYQNGQYIAFEAYTTSYTLYFSGDFGATFKTKGTPEPIKSYSIHINYLGEIMIMYPTSLYYAASFTSAWVLIEDTHYNGCCRVSWDLNTIVYTVDYDWYTYYLSTNKGISFTAKSITGSPFSIQHIQNIVMSGDGSKVCTRNYYSGGYTNTVINSITGTYITDSSSSNGNYIFLNSNYYGDYFTGQNTSSPYASCIKHLTTSTPFKLNGIYGRLAAPSDNGWATEYVNSGNTIRFYSLPSYSQYKSITPPPTVGVNNSGPISGDYVYFNSVPSGATYVNIYKVDNIVGHSYELINKINFGTTSFTHQNLAVSRVPLTLL